MPFVLNPFSHSLLLLLDLGELRNIISKQKIEFLLLFLKQGFKGFVSNLHNLSENKCSLGKEQIQNYPTLSTVTSIPSTLCGVCDRAGAPGTAA